MKKILVYVLAFAMLLTAPVMLTEAKATEKDVIDPDKIVNIDASTPILALGADLSAEQRATVLSLMEITEEDVAGYKVITITNEMEHQYLGSYMDASVIGTKSLSSVLITPKESGHGVLVTTKNINYCTTGMYRNALLTAGVSDAEILVAAPTSISGTAALIGAIKGYEAMSGTEVTEETLDTAMDELITTGEIADEVAKLTGGDSAQIEELIAFVKAKVAAGGLDTEEDIRAVIAEGEEKFGVKLPEDQVQQIVDIMMKINELGLDPQMLLEQAEDLYSQFGTDFLNNLKDMDADAIKKEVGKNVVSGFFTQIVDSVKEFFAGLFS
nr:DUF1002 domain-containing protein [Lachnospiraceae bacterium]MBQ8253820.1 DUF1002 domain-containing protein [Lachnospiraceae bacterium]